MIDYKGHALIGRPPCLVPTYVRDRGGVSGGGLGLFCCKSEFFHQGYLHYNEELYGRGS